MFVCVSNSRADAVDRLLIIESVSPYLKVPDIVLLVITPLDLTEITQEIVLRHVMVW